MGDKVLGGVLAAYVDLSGRCGGDTQRVVPAQ